MHHRTSEVHYFSSIRTLEIPLNEIKSPSKLKSLKKILGWSKHQAKTQHKHGNPPKLMIVEGLFAFFTQAVFCFADTEDR
jgi:hypothetical protein